MIHSSIVTPGLRVGQGTQANRHAPITLLVLLVYASYIPLVIYYIPVWVALIFYARIRADPAENSAFEGVQWPLGRYFRDRTARLLEVPLLLFIGLAVRLLAVDLGNMIAWTAVSSAISLAMRIETIREIRRQESDGRAEMAFRARISKGADW